MQSFLLIVFMKRYNKNMFKGMKEKTYSWLKSQTGVERLKRRTIKYKENVSWYENLNDDALKLLLIEVTTTCEIRKFQLSLFSVSVFVAIIGGVITKGAELVQTALQHYFDYANFMVAFWILITVTLIFIFIFAYYMLLSSYKENTYKKMIIESIVRKRKLD